MAEVRRATDKLTTDAFKALAFKTMAEMIGGVDGSNGDAVIEWCTNVGFFRPDPNQRGVVALTQRGGTALYLFVQNFLDGASKMDAARKATVNIPTTGTVTS